MANFLVIDNSSMLYRAFYALPPLTDQHGRQVGAVFGLASMLLRALQQYHPDYVVVATDLSRRSFRTELAPDYKATRSATPEQLAEQFERAVQFYQACGITCVGCEGYEADDLIGTLARAAGRHGINSLIISGDRDCFQLIDERTEVIYPRRGLTDVEHWNIATFRERYGLNPAQIVDMKALVGDKSDNIAGVRGVGEKTAVKLLQKYGCLESILTARTDDPAEQRTIDAIRRQQEAVRLSYRLATINCDAPVDSEPELYRWDIGRLQSGGCREYFRQYAMLSLEKRYQHLWVEPVGESGQAGEDTPATEDRTASGNAETDTIDCRNWQEVKSILEGQPRLFVAVGPASDRGRAEKAPVEILVPDRRSVYRISADDTTTLSAVARWVADYQGEIVTNDIKSLIRWAGIRPDQPVIDLAICDYLLDPDNEKHDPVSVWARLKVGQTGQKPVEIRGQAAVMPAVLDCMAKMTPVWEGDLYQRIERPLSAVLVAIEDRGMAVDLAKLRKMSAEFAKDIDERLNTIFRLAGYRLNINSPRQLSDLLFNRLCLPTVKKTRTGFSTDSEVLHELQGLHPIVAEIIEYRALTKLKSGFIDGLINFVTPAGRIHTQLNQTTAATGRLSSSNPNLQNIPVRSDAGRKIREVFVPGLGYDVVMTADYSQIELRVLAHLSQDAKLIGAFANNCDIHRQTAAEIFAVPPDEVSGQMRSRAKAINFGIIYGISDFGLSRDSGISLTDAREYIKNYFRRYPRVKEYINRQIELAHREGYVETILGRRRYIRGINAKNFAVRSFGERMAMNTPIQGSAADIIKLAMIRVEKAVQAAGLKSRMVLQVHDELVFEATNNEIDRLSAILRREMQSVLPLTVPLQVDVRWGTSWAECK
ncbi:MAG: DNA polymerase I [Negativicutes bacterium]|nr:DNA polymerase I [Negativicutes bacterium]